MINALYERLKAYYLNPCDAWAIHPLKPFGRALEGLTTYCYCCNGARIAAAAVAGAYFPTITGVVLGGLYAKQLIREMLRDEE